MNPIAAAASIPVDSAQNSECPVCHEQKRSYLFVVRGLPVCRCPGCGLVSLHPQPSPADIAASGKQERRSDGADPALNYLDSATEREASRRYLDWLRMRGIDKARLLLVAPEGHPFADEARKQGFEIVRQASVRDMQSALEPALNCDAAVVYQQLEKSADVSGFIEQIKAALRPDGVLLMVTPSFESWPRSFFGSQWTEWRPENLHYFDPITIQGLLLRHGFGKVWVEPERRHYSLRHIYQRASSIPRSMLTRLLILLFHVTPPPFRDLRLRFSCSGMLVAAQRVAERKQPVCSIVVPVYNEKDTFKTLMEALLAKQIAGVEKEIVVVESNSKDGTRELVRGYEKHPGVKVIYEERPRGKGHAVRTGLAQASGDIVLIQDADLEYDMNDYEELIEPLIRFRAPFVLGARHGGRWKMREFEHDKLSSDMLNIGHQFFTLVLNVLYRQRMCDPFTMYKLFWRDCLYGLEFECNRFDFDHELVIKLVRKGYTPLEIPVNYRSRSFKEGKKVNDYRDPIQWLWYDFKFRFVRIRKMPTEPPMKNK